MSTVQLVGIAQDGGRPFQLAPGGTADKVFNITQQSTGGGFSASSMVASGAITKNDLVELYHDAINNRSYVRVAGIAGGNNRIVGVSLHDCNDGEICTFLTNGGTYYTGVKNRTGGLMLGGSLLRLNPSVPGTVKAAADWSDGQVIGQLYINTADGTDGQYTLFGNRLR
jgi:hypothetical protein